MAATLREIDIEPIMAEAIVRRMDWSVEAGLKQFFGGQAPKSYRDVVDAAARKPVKRAAAPGDEVTFDFAGEDAKTKTAIDGASAESYRLINLRYQAGESTALEMVDAENTLTLARNAFADAQVRYRVALANLQTITGNF